MNKYCIATSTRIMRTMMARHGIPKGGGQDGALDSYKMFNLFLKHYL